MDAGEPVRCVAFAGVEGSRVSGAGFQGIRIRVRQVVQIKIKVSVLLMEAGVSYNKQRLHKAGSRKLLATNLHRRRSCGTGPRLAKRDNRFYVGNLNTFPIVRGSAKLYQVTHDGFIID